MGHLSTMQGNASRAAQGWTIGGAPGGSWVTGQGLVAEPEGNQAVSSFFSLVPLGNPGAAFWNKGKESVRWVWAQGTALYILGREWRAEPGHVP